VQTSNIAVIAFNHISPFHLSVPCLFFGENRDSIGIPAFHLTVCTAETGPVSTTTGFKISVDSALKALHTADIVIVPSWRDSTEIPPAAMLDALKAAHSRGAIIVGLCLGTFVLAAAGLLDGRKATTHWGWADQLQQMYPLVSVDAGVLYIDEGDVITSAGVAAGIDCCLHIIRRLYGAETAARLARRLVVPPHRQGGQAQYIEHPIRTPLPHDRFSEVLAWACSNLDQDLNIETLAARAGMSRRTFTRHFRQYTGTSTVAWLLEQRLELAQKLLETSGASVEVVAQKAGFGSALSLRKHFIRAFSISPGRYRKEFRST